MTPNSTDHIFHIPVMGTAYTIDTPVKVAHYGITSVMSIIDHKLVEQMRQYYSQQQGIPFTPIKDDEHDARARTITGYLDLVQDIVDKNFEALLQTPFQPGSEITKYFEMLPDSSPLKQEYNRMLTLDGSEKETVQEYLRKSIKPGDIDVNIMTKVDSANYAKNREQLPTEYNDAHASLRGFALSKLNSAVEFSAGMNPRLYGYIATFDDFFPDANGAIKKRIILKVSDYRSALIQGKFLAKKGLWVSEFRIESGLNCGGHAFATDGDLLGPIMQKFKDNRQELVASLFEVYKDALKSAGKFEFTAPPPVKISVQGGVGTQEEHQFLMQYYNVDIVGWGSPFLLVPEAVCIDDYTMEVVRQAKENDLYLSDVSPLGVPFNSVRGSSSESEKLERVQEGKYGFACLKKFLTFNTEFSEKPLCLASKQYQKHKINQLKELNLPEPEYKAALDKITVKQCLCVGLGNGAAIKNDMEMYQGTKGVAICPGPNIAYFDKIVSLREMVDHIYGRINIISRTDRPNFFIKELKMYIDYIAVRIERCAGDVSEQQAKYFELFRTNLEEGIAYYESLFSTIAPFFSDIKEQVFTELNKLKEELEVRCAAAQSRTELQPA